MYKEYKVNWVSNIYFHLEQCVDIWHFNQSKTVILIQRHSIQLLVNLLVVGESEAETAMEMLTTGN